MQTKKQIEKIYLELDPAWPERVADLDRLRLALQALGYAPVIPYRVAQAQYAQVREGNYRCTVTLLHEGACDEVLRIEAGDTRAQLYGAAIDLGSTSVVLQLLDLNSGQVLAQESAPNAQRAYGDDILTRIFYTKDSPQHRRQLQQCTAETINALLEQVYSSVGLRAEDCYAAALAGNTTMVHFLLGMDAFCIFHTPFLPRIGTPGWISAGELGLAFPGKIYLFPSAANYLGGDIISGLLYCGLPRKTELSLFLDIGTNGEMVLGSRDFLIGGAGAAGPALEAGISRYGMCARPGAVEHVKIEDSVLRCTTIGNLPPRGICGSGIVDLLAQMLRNGWMDESGRLQPERGAQIREIGGQQAVVYAEAAQSANGEALYFTQQDIFQFTNTKAAAHTMVAMLLQQAGLTLDAVQTIYLAGAFGEHMDTESAITIGMYPDVAREKFVPLGNSSLLGAADFLRGKFSAQEANALAEQIYYLEFAMQEDFLSQMRAARFYPHTDLSLYPTVARMLRELEYKKRSGA